MRRTRVTVPVRMTSGERERVRKLARLQGQTLQAYLFQRCVGIEDRDPFHALHWTDAESRELCAFCGEVLQDSGAHLCAEAAPLVGVDDDGGRAFAAVTVNPKASE